MDDLKEAWRSYVFIITRSINRDLTRKSQDILGEYGLSSLCLGYALVLMRGKATMRELSDRLNVDRANTTRAILDMREHGIVFDDRDTEKSRKYNVYLTERGKVLAGRLQECVSEICDAYFVGVSDGELRSMIGTMGKICKNVDLDENIRRIIDDSVTGGSRV